MSTGTAGRYAKKPVTIDAICFDGTQASLDEVLAWAADLGAKAGEVRAGQQTLLGGKATDYLTIVVSTLEGPMLLRPGWWLIRGVEGEFYPCKPSVFEATYDREREGATS